MIYTTNVIESVNSSIRHITNNRALFPNDESVFKLLYLALTNASRKRAMPVRDWRPARQQLAIVFEGRVPIA